jgi:hypothetical protein
MRMVVLSVILSGVEESQLYLLNISTDSPETVRDLNSFVSRLSRGYPCRATVYVARPNRSILDFARNDKCFVLAIFRAIR